MFLLLFLVGGVYLYLNLYLSSDENLEEEVEFDFEDDISLF